MYKKYLEIQSPSLKYPQIAFMTTETREYAYYGHRENLGDDPSSRADLEVLQRRGERSYQIKEMSTETYPTSSNYNVFTVVTKIY